MRTTTATGRLFSWFIIHPIDANTENELHRSLKEHIKDFYAAGIGKSIKREVKCNNVNDSYTDK